MKYYVFSVRIVGIHILALTSSIKPRPGPVPAFLPNLTSTSTSRSPNFNMNYNEVSFPNDFCQT